jgi:hypothetical protein
MSSRGVVRSAALLAALLTASFLAGALSAGDRWAALAPNAENSSNVVWATSKEEAKKLAVLACKQSSSTCAETPASTNAMDNMFAVMCCETPRSACAAGVGADRASALNEVKTIFNNGGFSKCTLKNYFKAGTGEKG